MDENGGSKVTGVRQIGKLKDFLQKWQSITLYPKDNNLSLDRTHGAISPAISRIFRSSNVYCDSDEEGSQSPELPNDVPKGNMAVYVGPELRRFIIPTSYLSHPVFSVLLEKVEEEFGFDHRGGLTIPCEIETFKYLLKCMESHQKHQTEGKLAGTGVNH